MKPLRIGSLRLKNPLILAPMVDVTDLPYRLICRKSGASLAYTEMLYISAILHENKKTKMLMKTIPSEKPIGIQITGNNAEEFKKVIPYLKPYSLVDINCGCPSSRITGSQAGSYLLNNPQKIGDIIRMLKKAGLTVTAKIRLGYKNNNVLQVAKIVEKAGADALTIHARMAYDGASIPADWSWIQKVKAMISIPVIGNGDISTGKSAQEMLKIADGAMIARAAIGHPLIFTNILHYLKTGKEKPFNFKANLRIFQNYLKLAEKYSLIDIPRIKHLGSHFLRNIPNASSLRQNLMSLNNYEEIKQFIHSLQSY